jgi:hypothetical protein
MAREGRLDSLPVEGVGDALVALHRARKMRDDLADAYLPRAAADWLKRPVPDVGDEVFAFVLGQLKQLNAALGVGRQVLKPLANASLPGKPPALTFSLSGRKGEDVRGNVEFTNRLSVHALPFLQCGPFRSRDGLSSAAAEKRMTIGFDPDTELAPAQDCRLGISVHLTDAFFKAGHWYFCDIEVRSSEQQRLAVVLLKLHVRAEP